MSRHLTPHELGDTDYTLYAVHALHLLEHSQRQLKQLFLSSLFTHRELAYLAAESALTFETVSCLTDHAFVAY